MRIFLSLVLLIISLFTIFLGLTPDKILFKDDIGLSFTIASRIATGDFPLLGQPSHFSGRHLGPVYYYYLFLIQLLSFGSTHLAVIILTFNKALALLLLCSVAKKIANIRYAYSLLATALIIISYQFLLTLRFPWVNNFLLIPSVFFYYCLYRLLKFGYQELPLFILSASLVVQSFLGTAPALLSIGIVALILVFFSKSKFEYKFCKSKKNLFVIGLIALVWLPPIVWELSYPSNILALFSRHSNGGNQASWQEIYGFILSFFEQSLFSPYRNLILNNFYLKLFFLIGLLCFCFKYLKSNQLLVKFIVCILTGLIATASSLKLIEPPYHHFYLNFFLPLPVLILIILYQQLSLATLNKQKNILVKTAGSLMLVILFYNYYINFKQDWSNHNKIIHHEQSLQHMQEVSQVIKDSLESDSQGFFFRAAGSYKHKKSAIYYLAANQDFSQNTYANTFLELEGFNSDKKYAKQQGYYLICESRRFQDFQAKKLEKLQSKWKTVELVNTDKCTTCKSCQLYLVKS